MDWILNLPLRLGLGEYWLVRRQFGRALEEMQELCRLAAAPGERTYLALGHQGLAEATLGEGNRAKAEREVAEALGVLEGFEAPLAEWRVCATAARVEEARGRRLKAEAYWGRGAAVLDRLATCLRDDDDLYRSFLAQPAVAAIRRNAKVTADTAPPAKGTAPAVPVGAPARPSTISVRRNPGVSGASAPSRPVAGRGTSGLEMTPGQAGPTLRPSPEGLRACILHAGADNGDE
jgi:hypothetical protein